MTKIVLVVGDTIHNGQITRIDEVHAADCRDLTRRRNEKYPQVSLDFTEYDSIDEARAAYDVDSEEMGWWFDEEVNILPCAHN